MEGENLNSIPHKAADVISEEGRELSDEEWNEVFGIRKGESYNERRKKETDPEKIKEFERRTHAPLTVEEKAEIQTNINDAREDVRLLAQKVLEKVWGSND